jgi:hypothetical protein
MSFSHKSLSNSQSGWTRTLVPLRDSNFRAYWMAVLFYFLAINIDGIARGWLAWQMTGKASFLGFISLCWGLPVVLISYQEAQAIHNLVRGVAPPYPGAFAVLDRKPLRVLRTMIETTRGQRSPEAGLYTSDGDLYADCGKLSVLRILSCEHDGAPFDAARFAAQFGGRKIPLA